MNPPVSAIIPTYNRASYILHALESAFAQNYDNLEVVIVDDGSTDDTHRLLAPYLGRICYVFQENQGVSVARNTAIAASHGQYIALLDSDDVWLPGKLARQVDFLEEHPEIGMVASHAITIDENGHLLSDTPLFPFQGKGWVSLETNVLRSPLPVDTLVVRRQCLPSPAPFTPGVHFGEDWEMCLRIGACYPIWYIDEPLAAVRVHETNVMVPLANQQQVELKLENRLGVIDRVFPILPGDPNVMRSLRARAEAREYAEAAVPGYVNRAFETAASHLGRAVALDPATWHGEELVALICSFAKLVFQRHGEPATLSFLVDILTHLPPEINRPDRLARAVRARTLIFTIGFDALAEREPRKATTSILQGLMQQPAYARNPGVLATLGRSVMHSVRPSSFDVE